MCLALTVALCAGYMRPNREKHDHVRWDARRNSKQYVIQLPGFFYFSTLAPKIIRQMKMCRKMAGVLHVGCVVRQLSLYMIVRAVDAASACGAIVEIDTLLHGSFGIHICSILQCVPSAVARFLLHYQDKSADSVHSVEMQVPASHTLLPLRNQATINYSKARNTTLLLLSAVQRIFERAGCMSRSHGLAKSLVWRFIGGALVFQIQSVGRILQNTIVYTCPFFRYNMLFSLKFPGAQSSAFDIVEQCKVGVWAEEDDEFLDIAGETDAVKKALACVRALRTNHYPNCIAFRDPVFEGCTEEQIQRAWYVVYGPIHKIQVRQLGTRLDCMLDCSPSSYTGSTNDLKTKLSVHGILAFDTGFSIMLVGNSTAIEKFMDVLTPIKVTDHVVVLWEFENWSAIVQSVWESKKRMPCWYKLTDPAGRWSDWWSHVGCFQRVEDPPMEDINTTDRARDLWTKFVLESLA